MPGLGYMQGPQDLVWAVGGSHTGNTAYVILLNDQGIHCLISSNSLPWWMCIPK